VGTIVFSTRWAGMPPEEAALRKLVEWSPGGLLIHERIRQPELEHLLTFLPRRSVAALALFSPLPRTVSPNEPSPFRMGSLHPEERRDALQQALRALEFADSAEIRRVIVPSVELEQPSAAESRDCLAKETLPRVWEGLRRAREDAARRQLDSYLSTLSHLLEHADRYSVQLALSLGGLPSEAPDVEEAERTLEEFGGAPLFLWADALSDSRYRRSAGAGAEKLRGELAGRVAGLFVADGDRQWDHLPLGAGEVDLSSWDGLRSPAAPSAAKGRIAPPGPGPSATGLLWAIDLARGTGEEEVLDTRERLRAFLDGPEAGPFEPFLIKAR